ncbi:hypothetical protein HDU67_004535 [Dinochytrium kinnereticum]|nr:hypothetical protein HDU67_004535 [Dinochytrium kinnereticum]
MEVARHGVDAVCIIEKLAKPCTLSRAVAVHARSLELLSYHPGLVERLKEVAVIADQAVLHFDGSEVPAVTVKMSAMESRYGHMLLLSQHETETIMEAYARETYGIVVQRETMLVDIEVRTDKVAVSVRTRDGEERKILAKYLVGCDGGHSAIRRWTKCPFVGHHIDSVLFYNLDVHLRVKNPERSVSNMNIFVGQNGLVAMIRCDGRDLERFRIILPDVFDEAKFEAIMGPHRVNHAEYHWISMDEKDRLKLNLEEMQALLNRRVPGYDFELFDPVWIHSPAGGQGMNTGLQDAFNLGWKLSYCLHTPTSPLLNTYTLEREPIARSVLQSTTAATDALAVRWITSFVWHVLGTIVVPFVGSFQGFHAAVAPVMGMLNVAYRPGVGVGVAATGRLVGVRAPDGPLEGGATLHERVFCRNTGHVLVAFWSGGGGGGGVSVETVLEMVQAVPGVFTGVAVVHPVKDAGSSAGYRDDGIVTHVVDAEGLLSKRYGVAMESGGVSALLWGAGSLSTVGDGRKCVVGRVFLVRPDGYVGASGVGEKGVVGIVNHVQRYCEA